MTWLAIRFWLHLENQTKIPTVEEWFISPHNHKCHRVIAVGTFYLGDQYCNLQGPYMAKSIDDSPSSLARILPSAPVKGTKQGASFCPSVPG